MRVTPKLVCYFSTGVNCTLPKTGQNCIKRIIKVNYSTMSYMFVLFLSSAVSSSQGLCISVFFRSILPVLFLHHKNFISGVYCLFCFFITRTSFLFSSRVYCFVFIHHQDFISTSIQLYLILHVKYVNILILCDYKIM